MPRKRKVIKRELLPDSKYNSLLVTQFINCLMKQGKKGIAEKVFYDSLDIIHQKTKKSEIEIFNKAISNVQPLIEVKSRRVGGATYQVPIEIKPKRKLALSIRWIINFAGNKFGKSMTEKLAGEILDAFNKEGGAIKKKIDTHKMAEANKAFAHFRW